MQHITHLELPALLLRLLLLCLDLQQLQLQAVTARHQDVHPTSLSLGPQSGVALPGGLCLLILIVTASQLVLSNLPKAPLIVDLLQAQNIGGVRQQQKLE